MSKWITGFIFGVILTIVAFKLLDTTSRVAQDRRANLPEVSEELASAERGAAKTPPAESEVGKVGKVSDVRSGKSIANPEPTVLQLESGLTPQPGAASVSTAPLASPASINDVYSPEIADVLENSVPEDLQAQYESEEKEESWATYMEAQFAAYFAQKPALSQFNISLIDCRTSICEIHALGYGPNAYAEWNAAIADITNQPWHDFNRMSGSAKNVQPDVLGIVLIMARNSDL